MVCHAANHPTAPTAIAKQSALSVRQVVADVAKSMRDVDAVADFRE
jgi:hypothetical protein